MSGSIDTIVAGIERSFDQLVATTVAAIWDEVPAYGEQSDELLRDDVGAHVGSVFRVLLDVLTEDRLPRGDDFRFTRGQAARRVVQGISLADYLRAFRIGQLTLWQGVVQAAGSDAAARDAALSIVGRVMHLVEVGSSVAAEAYLEAQQHLVADTDRGRRDLLEDLLARREISAQPTQAALRANGLAGVMRLAVVVAVPVTALPEGRALRDVASMLDTALARGGSGFTVVRHEEIVSVAPLARGGAAAQLSGVRRGLARLQRDHVRLAVGMSTVHSRVEEIADAYEEASVARDGLCGQPGVIALSELSSLDYLVLMRDVTARRLVREEVRRFVEDDLSDGGALLATVLEYAACDLNGTAAAERLHVHANTVYYRLGRIRQRCGCDIRSFSGLLEVVVAIRLLTNPVGPKDRLERR